MTLDAGGSLTSVPGVRVGHWTDREARTGCTVIVLPEPNVIAGEVRGAAPGSREYALMAPGMTVEEAHAIVLSGGSAYGLAAADGVMRELEAAGRGFAVGNTVVPIVPAAVIFDLMVGDGSVRPGPEQGAAAFRAASDDPVEHGGVGAGAGATVAKWRGEALPAGLGGAALQVGDASVAALVVANALGDVFTLEGYPLTGGPHVAGAPRAEPSERANTTLMVVATDAALTRAELSRVVVRSHDALAACVRPAHTRFDGDTCFAVSCGSKQVSQDLVAEAAFVAVGRALEVAVGVSR
jgi:L-aminopeptidase/D-esterase-like protein